jgi:hypothetical protein
LEQLLESLLVVEGVDEVVKYPAWQQEEEVVEELEGQAELLRQQRQVFKVFPLVQQLMLVDLELQVR